MQSAIKIFFQNWLMQLFLIPMLIEEYQIIFSTSQHKKITSPFDWNKAAMLTNLVQV